MVHSYSPRPQVSVFIPQLFLFFLSFMVSILLLFPSAHAAGPLRLGFSQEFGRDGRVETEDGGSTSDLYSETTFRVAPSHPMVFLDRKLTFGPEISISYTKYQDVTELDNVGYHIQGPLALELEGVGDESDSLKVAAEATRETSDVSTTNQAQATSTRFGLGGLYTRHWASPRWTSEFGYDYDQVLYDDTGYQDRDRITHTLSTALLYSLSRATQVGLRTSYAMESYSDSTRLATDTWTIEALARRRITDRIEGELALGEEWVSYDDGESDSGVTARGSLKYQVTPRWHLGGTLSRRFEPSDTAGETGYTTTTADLMAGYRFTPKLTVRGGPGMMTQDSDDKVSERRLALEATYAFAWFDLTVLTRFTDRTSDSADEDDSYTAVDAAVRVDVEF